MPRRHQSLSASLRRRGGGEDHHHDGGHRSNKRKAKLGRQYAFFTSCKSSTMIGGALAIIIFLLLSYLVVVKQSQSPLLVLGSREDKKETSEGADDFMEQAPFLRPIRRDEDERSTSCQHLPSIYWINLDVSKERRNVLVESMEASGVVDQHRVAAYDTKQTTALINSKQLMFHPQIQVYAGNGDPSFWRHPDTFIRTMKPHVLCLTSRPSNRPTMMGVRSL